jgi:putative flippase GtrA
MTSRKSAYFFAGTRIMIELFQQFIRFAGVGSVSAIGHYGLLIALVQIGKVQAVPASAAGALLGASINYALNYRFTFRSSKRHHESMFKFAIVAAIGLGLNTLFMWVGVDLLGAYYLLSQIVTTGLVMLWSFLGNRFWTFQEQS